MGFSSGAASTRTDSFACPPSVAEGDAVYISGTDTVDKAFAGAVGQTEDAIGVVATKPTATTATVLSHGVSAASFVGLTAKATYYLSPTVAGGITSTAPTAPGQKVQEIGIASSATKLFVDIEQTSVVL